MPFAEIFVSEARPASERQRLADAVHRALVETIDVPPDDRFQALHALAAGDLHANATYLGVARTSGFVAVRITLRRGRSLDEKRALYRAIADNASAAIGVRATDVFVVLVENEGVDWSFGNGVAQYAAAE